MERKLTANNRALIFRTDSSKWCKVELQIDEKIIPLGADTEEIVFKRLASGIDKELNQEVSRVIKEIDVVWVLSLFENHTSIYAGNSGEHRVLFLQGASVNLLDAEFWLDDETRQQWLSALAEF